jgi:hypothetical protein
VNGAGKKSDNSGEYHRTGVGGFLIRSLINSKASKFKTAKNFDPPSSLDSKKVMKDFMDFQKQWEGEMDKIQGYDIIKNRVHSPFFDSSRIARMLLLATFTPSGISTIRRM